MPNTNFLLHDYLVWGYVRLSQEDLDDPKSTLEEKFRLRRGICLEIAARHELTLPEHQILCERASGGFIANRPEMLRLLEYAEVGKLKYLVTPNVDRILRGDKADEALVENSFIDNGIVLITNDMGMTDFGHEDYDPLQLEVRTLMARNYRRQYIKKRRQTDMSRLSDNIRSQGAPRGAISERRTGAPVTASIQIDLRLPRKYLREWDVIPIVLSCATSMNARYHRLTVIDGLRSR